MARTKISRVLTRLLCMQDNNRMKHTVPVRYRYIRSTSYVFKSPEHAASIFNSGTPRAMSIHASPIQPMPCSKNASVHWKAGWVLSPLPAVKRPCTLSIATILDAGSHIVSSRSLYGGSHNLLSYTLPRFGIDTTFVDARAILTHFASGHPAQHKAVVRRNPGQSGTRGPQRSGSIGNRTQCRYATAH